ncbi:hypothetical protein SDC9_157287 [bioreactor metagenome]|uniref:Uncharacterized protein n=1 Tax=bioreactor metagenome TaxID=1076179 RepID=A0A645FBQ9_9ZZZZ
MQKQPFPRPLRKSNAPAIAADKLALALVEIIQRQWPICMRQPYGQTPCLVKFRFLAPFPIGGQIEPVVVQLLRASHVENAPYR